MMVLSALSNSKLYIAGAFLGLTVTWPFAPTQSPGGQEPVFIHAKCDGRTASAVLESLKEQIAVSRKYVVIPRLDDADKMDEVLEIYMHCTQRDDMVAVATSYGKGRCLGQNKCASTVDGSSINSMLCDGREAGECGRTLFASFEAYALHHPRGR